MSAVSPWLYINSSFPTPEPAATAATAHSGDQHSGQFTHSCYISLRNILHSDTVKMAPNYGHGAQLTRHRTAPEHDGATHHTINNNAASRHQGHRTASRRKDDRVRETHRKRDRQKRRYEAIISRSPSPLPVKRPNHLVDRMTYSHGGEVQDPVDYSDSDGPPPRPQRGRSLQSRITREDSFNEIGGLMQPVGSSQRGRTMHFNTDKSKEDIDTPTNSHNIPTNPAATLHSTHQPPSTKPIQYGSSHHLPFNRHLHPPHPVPAATRPDPIRLLNSPTTTTSKPSPADAVTDADAVADAAASTNTTPAVPKTQAPKNKSRPVNTYKGSDPVKRLVQNKLLQRILKDQGVPRQRKKPDRPDLRCVGKRVFR